jgi:hypothetical protein
MIATKKALIGKPEISDSLILPKIVQNKRGYFDSEATRSIDFRIHQLKKLKKKLPEAKNRFHQYSIACWAKCTGITTSKTAGICTTEQKLLISKKLILPYSRTDRGNRQRPNHVVAGILVCCLDVLTYRSWRSGVHAVNVGRP